MIYHFIYLNSSIPFIALIIDYVSNPNFEKRIPVAYIYRGKHHTPLNEKHVSGKVCRYINPWRIICIILLPTIPHTFSLIIKIICIIIQIVTIHWWYHEWSNSLQNIIPVPFLIDTKLFTPPLTLYSKQYDITKVIDMDLYALYNFQLPPLF